MPFDTWWMIFGVPLLIMVIAWIGLLASWSTEKNRVLITAAMLFPTVATLIACGGLAYVQRGGKVDALAVYGIGFFASFPGAMIGFVVALTFKRWFSALALGVSTWMLFWFGLMMSAAD
jgi:hypothetical protein